MCIWSASNDRPVGAMVPMIRPGPTPCWNSPRCVPRSITRCTTLSSWTISSWISKRRAGNAVRHAVTVPHPRVTARPPDAEVGEVVIDEVIDGRKVPAIPDQVHEPADDRAVVPLESHGTPPLSAGFPKSRAKPGSPSDPGRDDPPPGRGEPAAALPGGSSRCQRAHIQISGYQKPGMRRACRQGKAGLANADNLVS